MSNHHGPATRFVILNAPRTGSNMLCTVLNSHPEILCHHEIFNPHVVGYARHLQGGPFHLGTIEERERDPVEFLGRVWRAYLGRPCVGFKLCWRQNETIFRAVLEDAGLKKIVLGRRNRLRAFVSLVRARLTGEWVVYRGAELRAADVKVEISPRAFAEHVAFNDAYYSEIEQALMAPGQSSLVMDYEDLFSTAERARLLGFLGVSAEEAPKLEEHTLRLTSRRLPELVSNFAELESALRGTEFESELHS